MFKEFNRYFISYIFHSKTRQRLLFLALVGLFISSFALIVLQSMMGGLQEKQIERAKKIVGTASIKISANTQEKIGQVESLLKQSKIKYSKEFEIELLVRNGAFLAPILVHAIDPNDYLAQILSKEGLQSGIFVGSDLANKIRSNYGQEVQLISPSHSDVFLGDIPRVSSTNVADIFISDVPEVDMFHGWVKLAVIQNLIREKVINKIRLYSSVPSNLAEELLAIDSRLRLTTWEEQNSTLVWALNLENTVMVFLFASMTMLVSLCITSGLMIFFRKIRTDLASFWILGANQKKLRAASIIFLNLLTIGATSFGLVAGLIFLKLFDYYGIQIMPDIFIDRQIPIHITAFGIMVSFAIPYIISMTFSLFSLKVISRDHDYLKVVRQV